MMMRKKKKKYNNEGKEVQKMNELRYKFEK